MGRSWGPAHYRKALAQWLERARHPEGLAGWGEVGGQRITARRWRNGWNARGILKDLLDGAKLGPAHYRKALAQWLERARRELGWF